MGSLDARIHKVIQERLENIEALFLADSGNDDERINRILHLMGQLLPLLRAIKSEVRDIQSKLSPKEEEEEKKKKKPDQPDDDSLDDGDPPTDFDIRNWPQIEDGGSQGLPGHVIPKVLPLPSLPAPLLLPMNDRGINNNPAPAMVGLLLGRDDPNSDNSPVMKAINTVNADMNMNADKLLESLKNLDDSLDNLERQLQTCCESMGSSVTDLSSKVDANQASLSVIDSKVDSVIDSVGASIQQGYQQLINEIRRGSS